MSSHLTTDDTDTRKIWFDCGSPNVNKGDLRHLGPGVRVEPLCGSPGTQTIPASSGDDNGGWYWFGNGGSATSRRCHCRWCSRRQPGCLIRAGVVWCSYTSQRHYVTTRHQRAEVESSDSRWLYAQGATALLKGAILLVQYLIRTTKKPEERKELGCYNPYREALKKNETYP